MKLLVTFVLFAVAVAGPPAKAAEPADALDSSAKCAAFYASAFGVPVELVYAVIEVESGWNAHAVSSKGAAGLMQLMPATAARFGVHNRFDVEDNIRGGVAYLSWLIRLFQGDLRLALAAYNAGESVILSRGLEYSSREVFNYVTRVAQVYRELRIQARRNVGALSVSSASGDE